MNFNTPAKNSQSCSLFFLLNYQNVIFFFNIREVLERDGTAVDAAIAALFCDSLYQSSNMGPGGGFFMTIYQQSTGKVQVLNARERDNIFVRTVTSYRVQTGLNWFMGSLGKATCNVHFISAQTGRNLM